MRDLAHNSFSTTPLPFPAVCPLVTKIVPLADVTSCSAASEARVQVAQLRGGAITIGNFDGVHRGHAALLRQVRTVADEIGGPAVAVVLDPHPATVLRPQTAPARLSWIERRAELMKPLGIDALIVCETTRKFLQLTAEEFFELLVQQSLAAKAIVEGTNFFFGRDRGGDIGTLRGLCQSHDIELTIAEPTFFDGEMISSTRIRKRLIAGDVEAAARLLGVAFRMRGSVVAGARRGRTIGFPTANLAGIDVVIPAPGVYGGVAHVAGEPYDAAIHIGPNPTFEQAGETKVEAHLIDYDGDLYGQTILVDLITHVRDIARFDSADRLVEQLDRDIQTIRSGLAHFRTTRT